MNFIYLFDLDYCLAPFNYHSATQAVEESLREHIGRESDEISKLFEKMYQNIEEIHHSNKPSEIKDTINAFSIKLPKELKGSVNFMWSRELWLKYLSDKHNLNLDENTIIKVIDTYWNSIAVASKAFPEVLDFLKKLDRNRVFIITGSDRRLVFDGSFKYDPLISERKKMVRVLSETKELIQERNVITGDPYDKPSQEFWEKVMKTTQLKNASEGIVVDDSLSIVISAKKFGFKAFLLDRNEFYKKKNVVDKVDGYITELNQLPL